jgi:transposase
MSNSSSENSSARARVKRPERSQIAFRPLALDQLLPKDHRARLVWQFTEGLKLSPLYERIRAVEGNVGRDAVDPRLLLALWLLATIEGIGSARQLARACERDVAFLWMCGDVSVNYHLLSDFRTEHAALLEQLLIDSVATMMQQGLVTLERVAQDGMRVRASAGKSSFRRRTKLVQFQQTAREHLQKLRQEQAADPAEGDRRRRAAQERAAKEREQRVAQALVEMEKLERQKEANKAGSSDQARASTSDPQARTMKMGDGGFRPAYNVQLATDANARMIVGVDVTNLGSDRGEMRPMAERLKKNYGVQPRQYLVDGGFATKDDIALMEHDGTHVFAPIHGEQFIRKNGNDPFSKRKGDSAAMVRFRQRMGSEEGKAIYRERCSVAEFPNAEFRNRGLQQFLVRGLQKVRAVAIWHALAFNLMRMITLQRLVLR